jgi:hypothetical protein
MGVGVMTACIRRALLRGLLVSVFLLLSWPASATLIWAQGGSLYVCYPGNQEDLSSNGCPCVNNNDCRGTCVSQTFTCGGVTGVPVCSTGNTVDASVDGCPCTADNECTGNCNQGTHTCGGVVNAQVCSIGNTIKAGANGCPCTGNNECQGNCVQATDTCGGVVGAVDDNQPGILGVAAGPQIELGNATSDLATLSDGILTPDGTVVFELYGPSQPTCTGAAVHVSSAAVAGNGVYASAAFVPTQPGTYRWVARYRGDAYNLTVGTACNDPRQTVLVFVDHIFADSFDQQPQ